jgi:crotonobetainyl-CoA:carnitine CoA-transferase CaiB-like acyl-CoA transferase
MGPLAGFRILDLSSVLMGPYATQLLGDLGADVVKVEAPEGDILRRIGPGRSKGMGGMFLTGNRSKRSIVLDLKRPAGRDALLRLAGHADVLVTNIRPAAMERLDLGYEAVAAANPAIVYVSLFGYGQEGPYAARPAYDDLIQGATGLPALTALASGAEPRYVPVTLADRVVGLHASTAILSALLHRSRTGVGQRVDVPMFETMAGFVLGDHLSGLVFDPPLDEGGYARLLAPDRRPYETLDGHVCALIYTDGHWHRFFNLVGRPEMLEDPRFADHGARTRHIRAIYVEVADILRTRTTAEWLRLLQEADIPCSPLNGIHELLVDPHLNQVGFFEMVDHPTEGRIRTMRIPTIWSATPPEPACQAPNLGEHGPQLLAEAGCAAEEIAAWIQDGALMDPKENP